MQNRYRKITKKDRPSYRTPSNFIIRKHLDFYQRKAKLEADLGRRA